MVGSVHNDRRQMEAHVRLQGRQKERCLHHERLQWKTNRPRRTLVGNNLGLGGRAMDIPVQCGRCSLQVRGDDPREDGLWNLRENVRPL